MKVLANSVSGESSLPGSQNATLSLCLSVAFLWYMLGEGWGGRERESIFSLVSLLIRAPICNPIRSGPHPMTSFNLNFLEAPSPNTVTLGIRASTYKF